MTALTDNYEAKRQDGEIISVPVIGSDTIFKGALVCDAGTGFASPCIESENGVFLGVAVEKADNSSGADGDIEVRVNKIGVYQIPKTTAVKTDVGVEAFIQVDKRVTTATTTNSISAGFVVALVDSATVKLRIDRSVA